VLPRGDPVEQMVTHTPGHSIEEMASRLLNIGERPCDVHALPGMTLFTLPVRDGGLPNRVAEHMIRTAGHTDTAVYGPAIAVGRTDDGTAVSMSKVGTKQVITSLPHHLRSHRVGKRQGPKQPKKSFWFFISSYQSSRINEATGSTEKLSFTSLVQNARAAWNEMDEQSRSEFEVMASKDKERYEREYELYRQEHPLPPTGPHNAHKFYQSSNGSSDIPWKSLSTAAKKPYMDMASQDQERYTADMEKYKEWCYTNGVVYKEVAPPARKRKRVVQTTDILAN
jgi:hypothetical protein